MTKIAYLFPLFPVNTQTFTLGEVVWLKEGGHDVRLVSLKSGVGGKQQPEASRLVEDTLYCPGVLSSAMLGALYRGCRARPRQVLGLFKLVFSTWREKVPRRESGVSIGVQTFTLGEWMDVLYRGNGYVYLFKSLSMVPYALYLAEVFEREGVAHVHCQWATFPATVGMLLREWCGLPYSVSAHAFDIYLLPRMLPAKLERAAFVVTCAEYNRRYLVSLCDPDTARRIHLNYHGADLSRFAPATEKTPSPKFRVVSAGWLKEYKGFHVVLEAVAILAARGVDVVFDLAGDGPQRVYLERLAARLGVSDRLKLHGFLDHGRLLELYRDADAFAIGSMEMPGLGRQDVIPNVIAEAMAVGVPVVATDMAGIPELVEDGVDGLLVAQRDPEAMADALERLAREPEKAAALARSGRAKVERIWDRDTNLRTLTGLFDSYVHARAHESAA